MIKTMLSALTAAVLLAGAAQAQSADRNRLSSTADVNYASMGTPGTIGAMNDVAASIATSPDDVVLQQAGRSTYAQGAQPLANRVGTQAVGSSAGTVGATPGR